MLSNIFKAANFFEGWGDKMVIRHSEEKKEIEGKLVVLECNYCGAPKKAIYDRCQYCGRAHREIADLPSQKIDWEEEKEKWQN